MKRYSLTIYKKFPKVTYYTIHSEGEEYSETDKFFLRFDGKKRFATDVQHIKYWLEKIGNENGAQERYFRLEGRAKALPLHPPRTKLRLYLHRISDDIVILGGGGKKTSKKVQNSPDALPHFELMNMISSFVDSRLRKQQLFIKNGELKGSLKFSK